MSRNADQKLAEQDQARKDQYTGMVQKQMNAIPSDYSPAEKSNITASELGGIDAGYGNLKDELMRRSAATGSTVGLPETLSEFSREAVRQKAGAAAKLQETFANVPVQRALQKASVFQPALSGMLYNRYPSQPGNSILNSIIGAGGAALAAGLSAFGGSKPPGTLGDAITAPNPAIYGAGAQYA